MSKFIHIFKYNGIQRSLTKFSCGFYTSIAKNLPVPSHRYPLSINTVFPTLKASCDIYTSSVYFIELSTVFTPSFADSITEGDVRWRCSIGDRVTEDELLGEIETDKTALPIHSPYSGIIEKLLVSDGEKVTEGQELMQIREFSNNETVSQIAPLTSSSPDERNVPDSEFIIPSSNALNSENFDSQISLRPIIESIPIKTVPSISPVPPPDSAPITSGISSSRIERRVKMSRMRLKISERLKASQNTAAMLTTFNEVDMSNVISMRNQYKETFFKKHGVKLGIMSIFLKSSAIALNKMPVINAVIDGNDILYRDYIDISVAVATSNGLVVPVMKNVFNMSLSEIEVKLINLTERANTKQLSMDDLYGGTFTVSNGGVFGSLYGTPIINPPQSAILGMHAIVNRPIALNYIPVVRPMMYVALTYDHRLIDGREAVLFLKKIKLYVEEPVVMLLDL